MAVSNNFLTSTMVGNEILRLLENNLTFAKHVNRSFDDKFGVGGSKIGTVYNVRKPQRFVGTAGRVLGIENISDETVPIVLNRHRNVGVEITSQDRLLSLEEFSDRILKPAVAQLANDIDRDGLKLVEQIPAWVGSNLLPADTLRVFLDANAKLDYAGAPRDGDRAAVVSPSTNAYLVDNLKGLFNSTDEVSKQYKTGNMGLAAGNKFSVDQCVAVHTLGTGVNDTLLVNGATQSGSTLNVDGATAGKILEVGDAFTIAGVYSVNPMTRETTGKLCQFAVKQKNTFSSGTVALQITPEIVGPNPDGSKSARQTVTALPADNAPLDIFGKTTPGGLVEMNVVFHKDAFVLACANLPMPKNVEGMRVNDTKLGISVRIVTDYDIYNDVEATRIDVLYGWSVLQPELAVVVKSQV